MPKKNRETLKKYFEKGRLPSQRQFSDLIDSTKSQVFGYDALHRLGWEAELHAPAYDIAVLTDGPVGYWRLGEASGTLAADASGNGHDGIYIGGVSLDHTGLVAGDDTAINIPTSGAGYVMSPVLGGTTVTALEAWFQTDSVSSHRDIVSLHKSNNDRILVSHRTNGKIGV